MQHILHTVFITVLCGLNASTYAQCTILTNTNDSGPGSLRAAIECANANPDWDEIIFNIPGAGPHVIKPASNLLPPLIDEGISINANANVILDGSNFGNFQPALNILGNQISISGLGFTNWSPAIYVRNSDGSSINNNSFNQNTFSIRLGPDPDSSIPISNLTISNNNFSGGLTGILFWAGNFNNIRIVDNTLQNAEVGIRGWGFAASDVITMENVNISNNSFENSSFSAIQFNDEEYQNILLSKNVMQCNSLGITLATGANANQLPPAIVSASTTEVTGVSVPGNLIEVFELINATCPASNCQGTNYLGSAIVNGNGQWSLAGNFPAGIQLTATATLNNNTSSFSACQVVEGISSASASSTAHSWVTPTPNPFSSSVSLQVWLPVAEALDIKLYDTKGRIVFARLEPPTAAGVHTIALSLPLHLSPGMYFCRLQTGKYTWTGKLIKQ